MPRDWTDGDLLDPASWNELVTSTNMRFPSAAARDAALVGGAAPVDGATCFLLDSNLAFKYVTVSGVGYWAPRAGTLCYYAYQTAAQGPLNANNVYTPLTNLVGLAGARNLNGWLNTATGVFTPKCPGYFEFFGGVGTSTYQSNSHELGLLLNGSLVLGSKRDYKPPGSVAATAAYPLRRFSVYLNGTTDAVTMAVNPHDNPTTLITNNYGMSSAFGAIYLGL